jgi:hypothetical protein
MEQNQENITTDNWSSWASRNLIAVLITSLVLGVTVFIAIYILFSPNKAGEINLPFIGQTLLPLWGTWIGTVLAFYFGKANFEAASKSYQEVIKNLTPDEKIAKLLIKNTMLPLNKIEYLDYDTEKPKLIKDILEYPRFKDYNRFAVFDQNKDVKYMIHRSTFFEFIYLKSAEFKQENKGQDTDTLILEDLLNYNDEKIKNTLTRGFGFAAVDATLLDAKRAIDSIDECNDVFITQTGKSTEPVLGLLTNNMIFEKAKV